MLIYSYKLFVLFVKYPVKVLILLSPLNLNMTSGREGHNLVHVYELQSLAEG